MSAGRALLYIASAAALGLLLRSLLRGPIPLWLALVSFAAYLAIAAAGVFKPQLRMYADLLWRGPEDKAEVALTFDDGPQPEHTRRILGILDSAGVKATFFVIGHKVDQYPEVVKEIVQRGHALGIHSYTHDRLLALRSTKRIIEDLVAAQEAVQRVTGQVPRLYRPPVGVTNPRIAEAARELGLSMVAWSVKGVDGVKWSRPERVAARVARKVRAGSIVLLHDALERDDAEPASIAALPKILDAIRERGLRVVSLETLVPELAKASERPSIT